MILVTCKKEANFYWGDSLGMVVAKIKNGKERYIVYSDKSALSMPYPYESKELIFITNVVPDDWVSINHSNHTKIQSFKEWAQDEYFYGNISGDGDNKDTGTARLILASKIEIYINDYVVKSAGSIEQAKREIAKNKYSETLKLYKERGYETSDLVNPEDQEINDSSIEIDDLKFLDSWPDLERI